MISFKQYITELFDTKYPIKKFNTGNKVVHHYQFRDENKTPYTVHITHVGSGLAGIAFGSGKNNNLDITGKSGIKSPRVLSTVGHIMKNHAKDHDITHYTFSASTSEPSRVSLYNHITKKLGGQSADGGSGHIEYVVPSRIKD